MSRSKSPESFIDRLKPKLKGLSSNHNQSPLPTLSTPAKLSNLYMSSQKQRISSISNLRSSKILKKKKSSGKFKSSMHKSPSTNQMKEDFINSAILSVNSRNENKKKLDNLLKQIENLNHEDMQKTTSQDSYLSSDKFNLFQVLFQEVIDTDKQFSKYLILVKLFYENYFQEKLNALANEYNSKIKDLDSKILTQQQEKHSLQRTLENISKENLDLSKDIENCENLNTKLQQKLSIIHNFNIESVPIEPETWKCLVLERNYYENVSNNLKKEIDIYKYNQDMFLKKFDELKAKGINIHYEFSSNLNSVKDSVSVTDSEFVLNFDSNEKSIIFSNLSLEEYSQHSSSVSLNSINNL